MTKMEYKQLKQLLEKYYLRETTAEEEQYLHTALKDVPEKTLEKVLAQLWKQEQNTAGFFHDAESEQLFGSIQKRLKPRRTLGWYRVAAAIFVLVCLGSVFYLYQENLFKNLASRHHPSASRQLATIKPGGQQAVFIAASGKSFHVNHLTGTERINAEGDMLHREQDGTISYQLAGNESQTTGEMAGWNTLKTPRGGQCPFRLPDGTRVWLNASSSLSFPANFAKGNKQVKITGEVYFEVAQHVHQPFEVLTARASIQVLGTRFNVSAYDDDQAMITTLLAGAVQVKTSHGVSRLQPGQQAVQINNDPLKVQNLADANRAIAWKNGFFYLDDSDVGDIMRQVARWYDIEVEYHGRSTKKLTGTIPRNASLDQVMGILTYSGLQCRLYGRTLIIN